MLFRFNGVHSCSMFGLMVLRTRESLEREMTSCLLAQDSAIALGVRSSESMGDFAATPRTFLRFLLATAEPVVAAG